jgi:hypothetical protein
MFPPPNRPPPQLVLQPPAPSKSLPQIQRQQPLMIQPPAPSMFL